MQEKTITITIDEQGNSTLDLNGFVGRECEKAFEDFRGGDTVKLERKTAAYYVTQDSQQERIRHERGHDAFPCDHSRQPGEWPRPACRSVLSRMHSRL